MNLDTLKQLTEAMKRRGDNPAAAALAIGVSEKTLSNWLAGRNEPRSEGIIALIKQYCTVLDIPDSNESEDQNEG